jgi:ADP-ribose pyrophosphatase YjhB (NUDIX family)
MLLLFKSHIPAYTRKDGTFVAAHEDKRVKRSRPAGKQVAMHASLGSYEENGAGNGAGRFVMQEGNALDLIAWHGTAAENLPSILEHGIRPQTGDRQVNKARESDQGKTFIAADKADAKSFAVQALANYHHQHPEAAQAQAVLLVIRVPAEARDSVEWGQNGVETFADVKTGVPADWIIGYQTLTSEGTLSEFTVKTKYTPLAKALDADGQAYAVLIFSGQPRGEILAKSHVKGYTKKDGTFVPAHETKVVKHAPAKPVVAQFDHKATLPAEAYARVGTPAEQPPAPAPKPKIVSEAHAAAIKQAKALLHAHKKGLAKPTAPKLVGAQYGGQTPGLQPAKPKWQNSLHGKDTSPGGSPFKGEEKGPKQPGLFGGGSYAHGAESNKPHYPNAIKHPQPNDDGKPVQINEPDTPTPEATWQDPQAVARFTPGSKVPDSLNGVPIAPWTDAPTTDAGWHHVAGQNHDIDEPVFDPKGKKPAAGVIIEEDDGRVWLLKPTNGFGGYESTFPKGRIEPGISLQASAIKEAFEETGLQVEITGFVGDIERSVTTARFYRARRVGGTPKDMGWEAQAVQLVPSGQLQDVLNTPVDRHIAALAGHDTPDVD